MCGIVAFIHQNSKIEQNILDQATSSLSHRGPDSQNTILLEGQLIGFGATRLKLVDITDQSNQPFQKHHLTLIFNGEIYNFRTIRKTLQDQGIIFQTSGDTELVIESIQYWGLEKAVQTFRGSFVFIIYDSQKNQICIARDIFGEKQLVYTQTKSGNWLFASEIKALTKHPEVTLQPDLDGLTSLYFLGLFNDPETSLFKNISHFPPATIATIDLKTNQITYQKYWDYNQFQIDTKFTQKDIPELAEEIKNLLNQSVKMQLQSDFKTASILSGGIDSSFITILANQYLLQTDEPNQLDCITAHYSKGGSHDYQYVNKLIELNPNLRLQNATFPEIITEDYLSKITFHNESPILGMFHLSIFQNYKTAHDLSYKTVINGQGSDELWFGYYHTYEFMKTKQSKNPIKYLTNYFKQIHYFFDYDIPKSSKDNFQSVIENTLTKYFPISDQKFQNKLVKLYFSTYLKNVMRMEDRLSMASSVEVRLPFLYQELVELALKIPATLKTVNQKSKSILRLAGKNILPKSIQNRAKTPFPEPQHPFLSDLQNNYYRDKVLNSNLIAETFRLSKNSLDKIYKKTPSRIKFQLYMLQIFENTFLK